MMISSADHYDLSVLCQAQAYQVVGQQKMGPLQPVGGGGGLQAHSLHLSSLEPVLTATVNRSGLF